MTAKIKLNAASGGGSVSIVAPTSTTSNANVELKLPIADGSSEQVIKTDGSGNLSFGQAVTAKNLAINGAMNVAQYGSSMATGDGFAVDRFKLEINGTNENPTLTQADVASGTTPYTLGFRKSWKVQNGNQTGGAGTTDRIQMQYRFEAQDIANSGWNYTSSSSYITLQFWVKSSVAQNFYGVFQTADGTAQNYPFETGSLTADTWTKVTKTISGNSNLTFDNDNEEGLKLELHMFKGTDYTASGVTLNTWAAYASGTRTPDQTSTWYTTNDATLEITGVQLEVGSSASAFAHETFADTFRKCQRYLFVLDLGTNSNAISIMLHRRNYNAGIPYGYLQLPVPMRDNPSMTKEGSSYTGTGYQTTITLSNSVKTGVSFYGSNSTERGETSFHRVDTAGGSSLRYLFSAEL